MSKNGCCPSSNSVNPTMHRAIIKLLSRPISKDDASIQCSTETQDKGLKVRLEAPDKVAASPIEAESMERMFAKCEGNPVVAGLNQASAEAQGCVQQDTYMLNSSNAFNVPEGKFRGEDCQAQQNTSLLEFTNFKEQTIVSSLQQLGTSPVSTMELWEKQSKTYHGLEDGHMRTPTVENQQEGFCKEHRSMYSSTGEELLIGRSNEVSMSVETDHHAETTCQDFCKQDFLHPIGDEHAHAEFHVCKYKAGKLKIAEKDHENTGDNPLFTSNDVKEKCEKGVDWLRRSSRIRKQLTAEIKDTPTQTAGSSLKEEEEIEPISLETASDICDGNSKVVQSDFFIPVSRKCPRAKKAELTSTPISDSMKTSKHCGPASREKRAREEKLAESEDGIAAVGVKLASNNQEFFKPLSKKRKQPLMNAKAEVRPDAVAKEDKRARSCSFAFDLWTEAKLAAEENAQLCGGKAPHPFFSQHKAGVRPSVVLGASEITEVFSSRQATSFEEAELAPSLPFHVTQLLQTEEGRRDVQTTMYFQSLQSCKVDLSCFKRKCSHSTRGGLDHVLRIPPAIGSTKIVRPGRTSVKNALESLSEFLKEDETDSKAEPTMDDDEIVLSLAYLEDRLKSCLSEHAKRCSEVQSEMSSSSTEGSCSGNLLWADAYQPQSPKQVCGNRESVKFLSAWLEGWQARSTMIAGAAGGELSHKKMADKGNLDEDYGDFQEDSDHDGVTVQDDLPPNILFLAGPVGSGKTAAVYACAKAHGYTVIEVNCSDNRNGMLIKQKFSESMESHRVGRWSGDSRALDNGPSSHIKKSLLSGTEVNPTNGHANEEAGKLNSLDRHNKQKRKQKGMHDDAPKRLSNFSNNKVMPNTDFGLAFPAEGQNEPKECERAMTVLLFEDVDMVFENDRGFMAAVAQVAATAKRPIILTSNDERLVLPLSLDAELLEFKRPSTKELMVLAYLICVAEGVPCRPELLLEVVRLCRHDIRLLLNYLQFWSHCKDNNSEEILNSGNPTMARAMQQPMFSEATALKVEAHHQLWPAFLPLKFPCNVTQLIASKLNEIVFEAEKEHDVEEGTKLEKRIVEAMTMLKKSKKSHGKVGDSPSRLDSEEMENVESNLSPEDSDVIETPVKNLIEAKALARSPILREKIKKSLAMTLDDRLGVGGQKEVLEDEEKALALESDKVKAKGSSCTLDTEGDYHKPVFHSTFEPIYNLWSEFRDPQSKHSLRLSLASKQSYAAMMSLSLLSENLSACDVMSCTRTSNQTADNSLVSLCSESSEDSSLSRACSLFAYESLLYSVQDCTDILDEHERRITISSEAMMLAIKDPCTLGKLFTNDGLYCSGEWKLHNVGPSCGDQDLERLERKHALQCSLSTRLPPKAQASLQGAAFHECVGFLARMGHLEHDRLASAGTRRRARGFQNYFTSHPWNLSRESIDILQQFGRFDRC